MTKRTSLTVAIAAIMSAVLIAGTVFAAPPEVIVKQRSSQPAARSDEARAVALWSPNAVPSDVAIRQRTRASRSEPPGRSHPEVTP